MGIRELGQIYGPKCKNRVILRRAISAELPGGAELCGLVDDLYRAKVKNPAFEPYWERAVATLDKMKDEIARRYDFKTAKKEESQDENDEENG